jgi:hypothetical protein
VYDHTSEIETINKKAEADAIQLIKTQAGKLKKGVRFKMVPLKQLENFMTYDYVPEVAENGSKTFLRTGRIVKLDSVTYYGKFEPEVESTLPAGYVIPAAYTAVVENLKKHGVAVTTLSESKKYNGEVFQVEKYETAQRKFEGHNMARATGTFVKTSKTFKKGDYVVDLAQPLGNLAFYFLEPESDDGYVTWNFFDDYFEKLNLSKKIAEYPVFKFY